MKIGEWLNGLTPDKNESGDNFSLETVEDLRYLIALSKAAYSVVAITDLHIECPLCTRYVDCQYDCPAQVVRRITLEIEDED